MVNDLRLYAWRTKFHSLAFQHNLNERWRFMSQIMDGSTDMGPQIVYADFRSWYLGLRYQQEKHSVTFRYDWFRVWEDDLRPNDQNDSDGYGVTLAWRYQLNSNWELGAEYHYNENSVANRVQLDIPIEQNQSQSRLVIAYHF